MEPLRGRKPCFYCLPHRVNERLEIEGVFAVAFEKALRMHGDYLPLHRRVGEWRPLGFRSVHRVDTDQMLKATEVVLVVIPFITFRIMSRANVVQQQVCQVELSQQSVVSVTVYNQRLYTL